MISDVGKPDGYPQGVYTCQLIDLRCLCLKHCTGSHHPCPKAQDEVSLELPRPL
jgi:hypothetical protein